MKIVRHDLEAIVAFLLCTRLADNFPLRNRALVVQLGMFGLEGTLGRWLWLCSGVVWCGVVWCGAVRFGSVRCGMVRCGAVWCGSAHHEPLRSRYPDRRWR